MLELFIATGNRHKVEEISGILAAQGIKLRWKNLEIVEPDSGSLEEISCAKARQAFAQLRKPVIAEDTGVYFDAYDKFPGVLAKRVYLCLGFDGLLALIRRAKNRKAHFSTAICYYDGKTCKTFSGTLKGNLLTKAVSVHKDRLPYEKLFIPEGCPKALVDLPLWEKNLISHRARAARKLAKWLAAKRKK